MTVRSCVGRILLLGALAPCALPAQQLGIQAGPPLLIGHTAKSTLATGNSFSVTSPFTVHYLGFFDNHGDGLLYSHDVGIYDALGALLSFATIPAGTSALLDGDYRLVSVQPFTLAAGTNYNMVGVYRDEDYYLGSLMTAPEIQVTGTTYCSAPGGLPLFDTRLCNSKVLPDIGAATFAGSAVVATPEPTSLALLGTGLVGLGLARRRRVRST
jgi:PEP-CTERM motif